MVLREIHEPILLKNGFRKVSSCDKFNPIGTCYKLDESLGSGYYWIYSHKDLFSISIHDFYFHDNFYFESQLPEYLGISYYESVSGEEINPYRRLKAGCVKSYWYNGNKYQAIFHKNIPMKSIGIDLTPKYCDNYLEEKYSDDYINPRSALLKINETTEFPEMVLLLHQLKAYKGTGISAKLFYEGKVAEAISLILSREDFKKSKAPTHFSQSDIDRIENVVSYINDHYAYNLTLSELCKMACMGTTKLKTTFKGIYNCTITEYIQNRRMSQGEHLLSSTDFDIKKIALIVGYKSAARFSELFKKSTGLQPREYRALSKGK